MTSVRALDSNNDWTFGSGTSNYKRGNDAIGQNIQTRLSSFIGNCFFDMAAGVNWFVFLGGKNQIGLNLAISAVIVNTPGVTGLLQQSSNLSPSRVLSVSYQVQTIYSVTNGSFVFDVGGSL